MLLFLALLLQDLLVTRYLNINLKNLGSFKLTIKVITGGPFLYQQVEGNFAEISSEWTAETAGKIFLVILPKNRWNG